MRIRSFFLTILTLLTVGLGILLYPKSHTLPPPSVSPMVSVVMPVYNRADLVGRAIDSILNQTFTDFEFVIVDDGSTDDTPRVLKNYAERDNRIRIITNPGNKGISYSRQRGAEAARGTYIAIMDSDDWSIPDRLEKSVLFMRDHPDIDAVSGYIANIQDLTSTDNFSSDGPYHLLESPGTTEVDLAFYNAFPNVCALYKRTFAQTHNIRYNTNLISAEDYDFWRQFVMAGGHLAFLDNVLVYVRFHGTNSEEYYEKLVNNSLTIHRQFFELFFTPTETDIKFSYSRLEQCRILRKMIDSDRPRSVIPLEWLKNRYKAICPQDLDNALFIKHPRWEDFLVPTPDGKWTRKSLAEPCQITRKGNTLQVDWDHLRKQ